MLQLFGLWFWVLSQLNAHEATVGLGANCRYHPNELPQALVDNSKVFLTNEFTITGLRIENAGVHLIGGYASCTDVQRGIKSKYKTKVTGGHETVALHVNTKSNDSVVLENFDISAGQSLQAGGIEVVNVNNFRLANSWVHGNVSKGSGGGIHFSGNGTKVEILDSKIYNNYAGETGGGIAISGHYNLIEFQDSLVFDNQAGSAAGGLICQHHNQIKVVLNQLETASWAAANSAPLAPDIYRDLQCQVQLVAGVPLGFNHSFWLLK